MLVSCVSGVSIEDIEKEINIPTIRMMANLPIKYKKGTISYVTSKNVNNTDLQNFLNICRGPKIVRLDDDKKIDVSTILTGSMPGFISYLSQEYINFGINNGLSKEETLDLYTSSVEGTMNMIRDHNIEEIILKVSSPNGVTGEGIKYLESRGVKEIISKSLKISFEKITNLKN